MNATKTAALSETAVAAYETLRHRILDAPSHPASELGLGVLLRQGMFAWIGAHALVLSEPRADSSNVDATRVPMDLHNELIHVMVTMAMASNISRATQRGALVT